MNHLTRVSWFRPLTLLVLTAFFAVYGVDLVMLGHLAEARAESVDDLLNADDSGLLNGTEKPSTPPAKASDLDDEEEPAPAKPVAKPAPAPAKAVDLDEEEEPVKSVAKPAPAPVKAEDLDEDEPVKPAVGKAADLDEEEVAPAPAKPVAKPMDLDEEDEEPVKPAKKSSFKGTTELGKRIDGPTKVAAFVFPANAKNKKRSAEASLIIRDYLRAKGAFTHAPVNSFLGDATTLGEAASLKRAEKAIKDGVAAFENGDYETAGEHFDTAADGLGPWLEVRDAQPLFEKTLAYAAASAIKGGEKKDGREIFQRLLQVSPKVSLADYEFESDVRREFEAAKEGMAEAPKGAVSVSSDPQGLPVFIDGQFRGLTPIQIDSLIVGKHYVKVSEPGLKDAYSKLTVYEGMTKPLPAKPEQTAKIYDYKANLNVVSAQFEHRQMWKAVQGLGEMAKGDRLLFCRVAEANGIVTLTAFYYDLEGRQYKTATTRLNLSDSLGMNSGDLSDGTIAFLDRLFDDEETEWQGTYFKETKAAPVAAAGGKTPVYKTWWLWTIVGVVVAGAATGAALGLTMKKSDPKGSDGLGNGMAVRF